MAIARKSLQGVGDASKGEWIEESERFCHIRRRLNEEEENVIGPPVDLRGTFEAQDRARFFLLRNSMRPMYRQLESIVRSELAGGNT